jgi:hypothetical protein
MEMQRKIGIDEGEISSVKQGLGVGIGGRCTRHEASCSGAGASPLHEKSHGHLGLYHTKTSQWVLVGWPGGLTGRNAGSEGTW